LASDCPADKFQVAGFDCHPSVDVCDAAELCSGTTPDCPIDTFITDPRNCGGCDIACYEECATECVPDYEWTRWKMPPENPADYSVTADTVTDNVTGLVWQRISAIHTAWAAAKTYCDQLVLAGASDWRLPTHIELVSLFYVKPGIDDKMVNTVVFPDAPTDSGWPFWSSTPIPPVMQGIGHLGVAFDARLIVFGVSADTIPEGPGIAVRCVRGEIPSNARNASGAPNGRYTIANGVVFDEQTKLAWQQTTSLLKYLATDASTYCAALTFPSFSSGWRVPTWKELHTLMDARTRQLDPTAFPDAADDFYWSSDTSYFFTPNNGGKKAIHMGPHGYAMDGDGLGPYRVRCVH
jgi:hypothetical protein